MPTSSRPSGFTFSEMLVVLLLISILASLAAPRFRRSLEGMRARAVLNQVTAELYRARMSAVERGGPVSLVLRSNGGGCVTALELHSDAPSRTSHVLTPTFDLGNLCLRHSGDSIVTFNGRGMLRPPTRSLYVSRGAAADSVLISIAGRVRRNYRRRRGCKVCRLR